ncbi:MAG TPA: adenylate/guanylate cyclase domain-containing protein [Acidimicrobiia bacterium]|nr:adenylate/guanylate cyclase domain-containing protein [Acidimicrobiia bacterium]
MTADAPDGPGAITFTDIVGFTEFTATEGDAAAIELLDRQTDLVHDVLPAGGRIVKELGDGLLIWLPAARPAVDVCLELLDRLMHAGQELPALWVRIGMHWGSPARRGDDLVGHDVNLAARIVDVAGPGELLVSAGVFDALDANHGGVSLDELGPIVMRGIPDPVRLYRATRPGQAPASRPL